MRTAGRDVLKSSTRVGERVPWRTLQRTSHRGRLKTRLSCLCSELALDFSTSMPSCPQSRPTSMASTRTRRLAASPRPRKSFSAPCWSCSLGTATPQTEVALQERKRCVVGQLEDTLGSPGIVAHHLSAGCSGHTQHR
jgi:hypothetical protein